MKRQMIRIILCTLIFTSCINTCEDVKKYSMTISYSFKVTEKSRDKYIKFKGFDKNNNPIEFEEGEFWDIYNSVEIGDSIVKQLGKTEMILIKKDTTLVFPLMCKGKIVE
jgi:hypothetical protein